MFHHIYRQFQGKFGFGKFDKKFGFGPKDQLFSFLSSGSPNMIKLIMIKLIMIKLIMIKAANAEVTKEGFEREINFGPDYF